MKHFAGDRGLVWCFDRRNPGKPFQTAPTKIGYEKLLENQTTDALMLDANYVRRSDAELLWKGGSGHGR